GLLVSFGFLIIAMTVHEFAHGFLAYKLGDSTAKYSGRLTLNPLAHIDPLGTIIIPLLLFITTRGQFVFGAAKPIPINYLALRNPKKDIIWIGASGPLANFALAIVFSLFFRVAAEEPIINFICQGMIYVNVVLGVFNLIPIPPLDGSRILMGLLPEKIGLRYCQLEPYGFFIIVALIGLGLFDLVVLPSVRVILGLLGVLA
ncbi:MAG: site-2 protease family protein, partial [Candidatus Omnitrophica bacterium]|nr:site-2 protease family protein [Candidatus Omnitrophota bacterium]